MGLSPGTVASVQRALARHAFPHTYTLVQMDPGATKDDYNEYPLEEGETLTDLACRYAGRLTVRTADAGLVTTDQPNITVPADAEIDENDLVKNITDQYGNVLAAGPLVVDTVTPDAAFGPTLLKRVILRVSQGVE